MRTPTVRVADESDRVAVDRLVDGALLALPTAERAAALARGDALVAERGGRVVGALVLADGHVEAVAVARRHRRSGVGTAMVRAAAARAGRLTADFDADVRGFYEALGFDVERRDGRLIGTLAPGDAPVDDPDGDE